MALGSLSFDLPPTSFKPTQLLSNIYVELIRIIRGLRVCVVPKHALMEKVNQRGRGSVVSRAGPPCPWIHTDFADSLYLIGPNVFSQMTESLEMKRLMIALLVVRDFMTPLPTPTWFHPLRAFPKTHRSKAPSCLPARYGVSSS